MNKEELNNLLENVASGAISPKEAADSIKLESFKDLGFAKVDTNRELRQGMSEVIYGKSKTKEQIVGIVGAMLEEKEKTILITRMSREAADYVAQQYNLNYDELSQIGIIGDMPEKNGKGRIVVATGGTSDIPVAEEAARTAEVYGNEVVRLYDVGVAGMHRLMNHIDTIMNALVIIGIAVLEGSLSNAASAELISKFFNIIPFIGNVCTSNLSSFLILVPETIILSVFMVTLTPLLISFIIG